MKMDEYKSPSMNYVGSENENNTPETKGVAIVLAAAIALAVVSWSAIVNSTYFWNTGDMEPQ